MTNITQQQLTFGYTQNGFTHKATALHTFYFITAYKNTPFIGQAIILTPLHGLPYTTLRASYYFCLTIKIILLQLKILTFLTSCWISAVFPGLPHVLTS